MMNTDYCIKLGIQAGLNSRRGDLRIASRFQRMILSLTRRPLILK